ncbi:MAG: entericidin A/B family lipoprotein [Rhodospirillales bacterium]|nr:entericidin A/B family lipoprotein [Rhodospirillales bacterium]
MTLPLLMALSLLTVVALSACNTVSGAGEDLQAAGSAIEQKSDQKKGY